MGDSKGFFGEGEKKNNRTENKKDRESYGGIFLDCEQNTLSRNIKRES